MIVLVGYMSAHGSTRQIAERIAAELRRHGHKAEARSLDRVRNIGDYDAFVLGSAVHSRAWLADAMDFVQANRDPLTRHPTWTFSVGMPAALRRPWQALSEKEEGLLSEALRDVIPLKDHHLFSGTFRREHTTLIGHLIFRAMGGRYGDYRDRTEIDTWVDGIAHHLADTPRAQGS